MQCFSKNDFGINSILPVFLELNSNCKIIHPATDCESDNSIYGISKHPVINIKPDVDHICDQITSLIKMKKEIPFFFIYLEIQVNLPEGFYLLTP